MYLHFFRFFGLRENPFHVSPDPAYLFANNRTQSALDDLAGAIQARKGLLLLTGEVGTGKTTLMHRLKHWLDQERISVAFLFNPHLEPDELYDFMLAGFGIQRDDRAGGARQRLNQWLAERHKSGKTAVLLLDEAQGLPNHALEEVRLLLNQEAMGETMLQIVLCGQLELEERLRRPELRQIRQRINLRCEIQPLTRSEAHSYIQRRLQVAGASTSSIFSAQTIDVIHFYARGIPRVMNLLCEHALIKSYMRALHQVPPDIVDEVARQLQFEDVRPVAISINVTELAAPAPPERELSLLPSQEAPETSIAISDLVAVAVSQKRAHAEKHSVVEATLQDPPSMAPAHSYDRTLQLLESPREIASQRVSRSEKSETPDQKRVPTIRIASVLQHVSHRGAVIASGFYKRGTSFLSPSFDRLSQKLRLGLDSPSWQNYADSLLRWLQQPMSTVRVHRKVHH